MDGNGRGPVQLTAEERQKYMNISGNFSGFSGEGEREKDGGGKEGE